MRTLSTLGLSLPSASNVKAVNKRSFSTRWLSQGCAARSSYPSHLRIAANFPGSYPFDSPEPGTAFRLWLKTVRVPIRLARKYLTCSTDGPFMAGLVNCRQYCNSASATAPVWHHGPDSGTRLARPELWPDCLANVSSTTRAALRFIMGIRTGPTVNVQGALCHHKQNETGSTPKSTQSRPGLAKSGPKSASAAPEWENGDSPVSPCVETVPPLSAQAHL